MNTQLNTSCTEERAAISVRTRGNHQWSKMSHIMWTTVVKARVTVRYFCLFEIPPKCQRNKGGSPPPLYTPLESEITNISQGVSR